MNIANEPIPVSDPSPTNADSSHHILVIDDDPVVREMLGRVLREAGYQAQAARDCVEAMQLAAESQVDAALLNVSLDGERGWTALKQLKACAPASRVIVITAWPNQQAVAAQAGADACFEKPLDFAQLLAALRNLVTGRIDRTGAVSDKKATRSAGPGTPAAFISRFT